jgi:N-acetylmuramoyl-L-alanine amidase
MARRTPSDPGTKDLLARLAARGRRRRRLQIVLAVFVGLLLAILLAAALIVGLRLGTGEATPDNPAGPPTSVTTERATASTWTLPPRPTSTTVEPVEVAETTSTLPASTPATSTPATSTPASAPAPQPTTPPAAGGSKGLVVIDPGHQAKGDSRPEPIGPGSSKTKARVTSGTSGVATGIPEHELVLKVGLMLRDALKARGVEVVMTRTTPDVTLSNVERTQIANRAGADLFIRVHADGAENAARRGIHVLYPAVTPGWTDDIAAASKKAAEITQRELIAATGAKDLGIDPRDDMTGFNWSDVPVIIPEIGFMTNPEEDRLLATDAYRRTIAEALAKAAVRFLDERR